jgi:hypothetical protein
MTNRIIINQQQLQKSPQPMMLALNLSPYAPDQ